MKAFNKKITLLTLKAAAGCNPAEETARATVWADISDIGVTTKYAAEQVGQKVSFAVIMWRREYAGYTHAEYNGARYKIVQNGSTGNDLTIKLLLERG